MRELENVLKPRIPLATYRLQFNRHFTFKDATEAIGYLDALGVSDIYASPYFMAKEGSLHGYDIVDHSSLNPEVGTEAEYELMIGDLRKRGMGQLLDIVPNHMCVESKNNKWWMDVLENGPSSPYEAFFDIDWDPLKRELRDKVLLPILGDQFGDVLERQELVLSFEEGAFYLSYYENRFPIIPKTYAVVLSHRIDELQDRLSHNNPDFRELLSILTALQHLPSYTEREPGRREERHREKEIIKRRIWNLYRECPEIRRFIDENLHIVNGNKGDPRSFDLLDDLLNRQVYRLSFWRVATEEINYRRFFDINGLGAIRVENPEVFGETHGLIMRLVREGKVTGLRIDHPDGLFNPSEYFEHLQRSCFLQRRLGFLSGQRGEVPGSADSDALEREILGQFDELRRADPQFKAFYIVGEKILIKGERMPEEWPIFSTTGYVFMNSVNGVFVQTKNAKAFDAIYSKFTLSRAIFSDVVYEKKKLIMEVAMSSEVNTLGHYLNRISEKNRHTRDFTLNSLTNAIKEVIAFFPVYRTYVNSCVVADRDRQYVEAAVSKAMRKNPAMSSSIFEFLRDVLLLRFPEYAAGEERQEWLDFVMRFQQITGPVTAKGLEDTACYIYNRLVSLNDVGGSPDRFGTALDAFHGQNIERMKCWPNALIATATHDSKRGEDVRARINVLSEIPEEWRTRLMSWSRQNKRKKVILDGQRVPDRNEEYLLYQTLVGAWPPGEMKDDEFALFRERIKEYMLKAIREAKANTSWVSPNAAYEEAVAVFIEGILSRRAAPLFLSDMESFQRKIAFYGMFNSLSQTILKITAPGVPDFYQGTELWSLCLVDPDNRRLVDYDLRAGMLRNLREREAAVGPRALMEYLAANPADGGIKLYTTWKALRFRQERRELFEQGEYVPLEVSGGRADNVCAFARRLSKGEVIVAVPRFLTGFVPPAEGLRFPGGAWAGSGLVIPFARNGRRFRNILTGEFVEIEERDGAHIMPLDRVFDTSPAAVLERADE